MRSVERTEEMLRMVGTMIPGLGVNRTRSRNAVAGDALATDEVMRRVENGDRFREAYRAVSAALKRGEQFSPPTPAGLVARRRSTGGIGNPGLPLLARRSRRLKAWESREQRTYDAALRRLAGRSGR